MQGLFFTGTDTGVGKTFVMAAVVRRLRQQGREVRACKPVATGACQVSGTWLADDTVRLAEAAGVDPASVTRYSLSEPAAPPVAARQQGIALTLADYLAAVGEEDRNEVPVLVEGVGGLLCPLTEHQTVADLIAALRLPTVIVARRSLGTLNHTLLTVETALVRGLSVAGVVVCETMPPTTVAEATNVEELRKRLPVPLLAVVPFQAGPRRAVSDEPSPRWLDGVDWWALACRQPRVPEIV